jgi:membrane protein required for colicin V production
MIDIIFAIIIIVAGIKGFKKGLIVAVFSVIAFIVGLAAALKLSAVMANWLGSHANISVKWLPFISFALVFFIVALLVRWGGNIIEKTFKLALLGWVNRIGGIVFYAVLYIILFSVFLFYAQKVQLLQPQTIQASQTYSFVQPWGPLVIDNFAKVIPIFKDTFTDLEAFFSTVGNKIQH